MRLVEHLVGDDLADPRAGNLRDDVVEALDVLYVQSRVDVDVYPPRAVAIAATAKILLCATS